MTSNEGRLPLEGIKILDASTMLAAPWSCTFLADYGAEVIKVEHPDFGDHARNYGSKKDGIPLLWKTLNRNKKTITLNLKEEEGQRLFKELAAQVDVVVENFKPGTFEKWNLGWDVLSEVNPSLIMLRTTGYGQTGPYSTRGGFGTVAEAMSGFTSVNGAADGPPILPGIALADGVSGVFGALSIMIALHERINNPEHKGQVIDISLYEPLMRFLEPHLMAYNQLGKVAERLGNGSNTTAPRNAYQTKDGSWVALSASTQTITTNVFKAIGRAELIEDDKFSTNVNRLKHVNEIDEILGNWIKERDLDEVVDILSESGAVVGPMYDVSQLFEDPHYQHRETFIKLEDEELGEIEVPNVVAKFSRTPGKVRSSGATKGKYNEEIYKEMLGLSDERLEELKKLNII
ncbi:CoA transferase [Psychrobacillus sp. PGGUH221]|uniref:CaiB/BaiF CoA transferase family protein n=1 Tax=Psychrobacillus sp. PGGUH221 TaxID=3020058 RepID=UPI0035C6F956